MDDLGIDRAKTATPPAPPRWHGTQSIGPVCQLNERCFELLGEIAASNPAGAPSLVEELCDLWVNMDLHARRRAARVPFSIVDARFQDEAWWRQVAEAAKANPILLAVEPEEGNPRPSTNGLPGEASELLMLETLMFAWQTARWNRMVALVSFGMSPSVADVIAMLSPQQVRSISARAHHCVEVRWSNDLQFWRDLLVAAAARDEEKLGELHLLAKLLYCGGLV